MAVSPRRPPVVGDRWSPPCRELRCFADNGGDRPSLARSSSPCRPPRARVLCGRRFGLPRRARPTVTAPDAARSPACCPASSLTLRRRGTVRGAARAPWWGCDADRAWGPRWGVSNVIAGPAPRVVCGRAAAAREVDGSAAVAAAPKAPVSADMAVAWASALACSLARRCCSNRLAAACRRASTRCAR